MRKVTKENLIAQIDRLRKIKDEQGQLSMSGEYTLQAYEMLLATMEAEPDCNERQLFCSTDTSRMKKVISVSAGSEVTPLYRHAQPDTNHLSRICAESYQVVSALAEALRIFNDIGVIKALDNLSAQELIHDDVLPFLVPEAAQPAPVVPDELREAVVDFLTVLDEYPEQLVPINRDSAVVRALRAATREVK
nr:MAG TPA: hypothetical protein [Caudoviricetes sp.]